MHDGAMSDRDAVADSARRTRIDVDDDAVLYVRAFADFNSIRIGADDGVEPHAALRADVDVAQDDRACRHKHTRLDVVRMMLRVQMTSLYFVDFNASTAGKKTALYSTSRSVMGLCSSTK